MAATYTTNYNLEKPDVNDYYDIDVFNDNADKIDAALKENADDLAALGLSVVSGKLCITYNNGP